MIDRLLATLKQTRKLENEIDYSHEQAVLDTSFKAVPDADSLTVVFPPWHSTKALTSLLHQRLAREGSSSLVYDFNPLILSSDPSQVRLSFEQIAKTVAEEVNTRKHVVGYKKVNLLGFSLGNVALSMSAENLDRFDNVTMVVPGAELATPFWTGIRTRKNSDVYRDAGYQLTQIRDEWQLLAPIAHLSVMRGHSLQVILASADEYIPFTSGLELVDAMKAQGLDPTVQTSKSGHVVAITRFALGGFKSQTTNSK